MPADPQAPDAQREVGGHSQTDPARPPRKPPMGDLQPRMRFSLAFYFTVMASILLLQWVFFSGVDAPEKSYSEFRTAIEDNRVSQVVLTQDRIYGKLKPGDTDGAPAPDGRGIEVPTAKAPWHLERLAAWWRGLRGELAREEQAREADARLVFTVVPLTDPALLGLLQRHGVDYRGRVESHWLRGLFFNWVVPLGIMFVVWGFFMRRMGRGPGVLQMGQSRAKIYEVDPASRVRFTDLAGVDEAIEETREVVSFLRDPQQFTRLGAKLPKGVLLVGPPGTGKTLLARAIAGEAEVPFYSLSGSDFVEMFVGVGAARVRDLFQEAKKVAPCIVFIDELDAVGKSRGQGGGFVTGGYDERENTLNQLLVEMDGFDASAGVVILAATNRPEVLDPALLRAGRFDRRVLVDRPSREGRNAIFRIHARRLPLGDDIDFDALAAQTPGMVGADIANVCNEAALLASRVGRDQITMADFQEAIERTIAGPQKKSQIVTPEERRRIAYHESGHALAGHLTCGGDPVQKISIIPRSSGALGYTLQMPLEDRYLLAKDELLSRVRVLLSGRAAEEIVFGDISTGASDDLEKASQIVRSMLAVYGMSTRLPNVSLAGQGGGGYLGPNVGQAPHSEDLARTLDAELAEIIDGCYREAKALLARERGRLELLAQRLLEAEQLDRAAILSLLGASPELPVATGQRAAPPP
jgi:cell division protease FtsH